MEFTAQQIADFLGGEIQGDPTVKVHTFSKIEEGVTGTLSFLSNPKYCQYLYESQASIILVNRNFTLDREVKSTIIRVDDAYQSLAVLLSVVEQTKPKKSGISTLAFIDETAIIDQDSYIAPFVYIGKNVKIGKNAIIHTQTCIEDGVSIGDNVLLKTRHWN